MNQKELATEISKALGIRQDQSPLKRESFTRLRLDALGHAELCSRCCGTGQYSYNQMHGTRCFGCGGVGKKTPKLTKKLLEVVKAQVENNELAPYFAEVTLLKKARAVLNSVHKGWEGTGISKLYSWSSKEPEDQRLQAINAKMHSEYKNVSELELQYSTSKKRKEELAPGLIAAAALAIEAIQLYAKEI